jgi:precorrin-6Y C5,15-methyltransferase (decarboxylating)
MGSPDETLPRVEENLKKGDVAVLVSGDAGIFSLLPRLKEAFRGREVVTLPGVSALQSLAAAMSETWEDAAVVSLHGRDLPPARAAGVAAHNAKTFFFCGPRRDPAWLCRTLAERDIEAEVTVGERLSYPDERITRGRPAELRNVSFAPLSVVLVRNPDPLPLLPPRPRDEEFLRQGEGEKTIPMTREEARTLILDKLFLDPDSLVWDIGAGTGSVSVACARACPYGEVHAVERLPEAAALIRTNKAKFRAYNLFVHEGGAADLLETLPPPTHVFIGGSGGELKNILERVIQLRGALAKLPRDPLGLGLDKKPDKSTRVVVSGVTLETIGAASEVLNGPGFRDFDALQISVSRSKTLGKSVVMAAQNPVTLLSAWTEKK